MCLGGKSPKIPDPPPLPPPPPPPPIAPPPIKAPEPVQKDVNPQVRAAKSKKAKGEFASGTGSLRIPLNPQVSTQAGSPGATTGGINT